ncbi:TlpA disulfide reductase family protein [Microbacterium sp. STN6]|uniref:TlpA family protein disulfide reductase n=1 Tax=Microbacterium sp. STN6 TaxID=2995588 RepID=UPI002260933A|nr:TlpA disulfide reductase family protein [Microbacterium sp. STN6]MCX7520676.1 TlpA disulfide reductase family protein [Microbacterium sp. STN6]
MGDGPKRPRALAVAALLVVAGLLLTGCTNDPLAQQFKDGGNKQYIAGSGVTEVPASHRDDAVTFSGKTEDGSRFSSKDHLGDVLVVNFWYASCAPCRIEASDLQSLNEKYAGKGVNFIGVNTEDQAATATAFEKKYGVTYPSIIDVNSGAAQLAFSGSLHPNATPTTLVLDRQGRIAARIEGPINDQPSTLDTLISDTLAESN